MNTYKIDILKTSNTLITQNMSTQDQKYFTISELKGELLLAYTNFNTLVDNHILTSYTQIYIAKQPVVRFVTMTVEETNVLNLSEVLYDNLTTSEKIIFDTFYNSFTK
jgi:hypothetical protein